jgi:uncharacterized membrane protein YesL
MPEEPIFSVAPGEKVEDDRSRLGIFFGVLGRKFWKLITTNAMFMLFNIPALIIGFILSIFMLSLFYPETAESSREELLTLLFADGFPTVFLFMAIPALTTGPAQAGLTYILRCYSYEQPVFQWMDFKDKMKENFKQGTIVSLINLFLLAFLIYDFYLYSNLAQFSGPLLPIANGLLIIVFIIFFMVSMYLYPMMVTYSLKTKDLYKNAMLFAVARFLPNLGILLICLVLILGPIVLVRLTSSVLVLTLVYAFYVTFGFTLPGLIINSYINPTIDKYLKQK